MPTYRQSRLSFPLWVILAAMLFVTLDICFQYDKLPPQIASHFDVQGRADGWSTKLLFVSTVVAVMVLLTALLSSIQLIAYYAPFSTLNMPNKEYWMDPEREGQARRMVAQWGLWFTAATLWFMALIFHETLAANFRQPPQLHSLWWLIGGYMAAVVFSVFRLTKNLRPANAGRDSAGPYQPT